jgi:hypothetical protein
VAATRERRLRERGDRRPGCYDPLVCIICLDFEKGRMTAKEARRALGEMVPKVGAKHAEEIERTLREAEEAAARAAKP